MDYDPIEARGGVEVGEKPKGMAAAAGRPAVAAPRAPLKAAASSSSASSARRPQATVAPQTKTRAPAANASANNGNAKAVAELEEQVAIVQRYIASMDTGQTRRQKGIG